MGVASGSLVAIVCREYLFSSSSLGVEVLAVLGSGLTGWLAALICAAVATRLRRSGASSSLRAGGTLAPAIGAAVVILGFFVLSWLVPSMLLASRAEGSHRPLAALSGLGVFLVQGGPLLTLCLKRPERFLGEAQPTTFLRTCLVAAVGLFGLGVGVALARSVLFEQAGVRTLLTGLVAAGATTAGLLLFQSPLERWKLPASVAAWVVAVGILSNVSFATTDVLFEKLYPGEPLARGERLAHVFENSRGVVTITSGGVVRSNGLYQGMTNVSPLQHLDKNRTRRAYLIPSIVSPPRRILMIGLGTGTWTWILANHPEVESITVVENDKAFRSVVENTGATSPLLTNPKVSILEGSVESILAKMSGPFDVIIQDRIAYRRPGPSPLLTKEHFESLLAKLSDTGAVYLNADSNPRIEATIASVFPHVLRYHEMIFGAKQDFTIRGYHWMEQLESWTLDGRRVLPLRGAEEAAHAIVMERSWLTGFAWERDEALRKRVAGEKVLTKKSTPVPLAWKLLFATE